MVAQPSRDLRVPPAAAGTAAVGDALPSLSGRLFKRSSVLGRVTWTLQLINLNGTTLSYTNKEGKDKAYDVAGCVVAAPQVRFLPAIRYLTQYMRYLIPW
jgi:hypothetical protein